MRRGEASGANEPQLVSSSLVDDLKAFTDQRHLFGGWSSEVCTFLLIIVPQMLLPPGKGSLPLPIIIGKLSINILKRDDVDLGSLDATDRVMLPVGHNAIVPCLHQSLLFLLDRPQ